MNHLITPLYSAKTPDDLPQARLSMDFKRHIMKLRIVRCGDYLVIWNPRRGVHVHRIVKNVDKRRTETVIQFEDGGSATYLNGGQLMVDRRYR